MNLATCVMFKLILLSPKQKFKLDNSIITDIVMAIRVFTRGNMGAFYLYDMMLSTI